MGNSLFWRFKLVLLGFITVFGGIGMQLTHAGVQVPVEILRIALFAMLPVAFFIAGQWWLRRDLDDEP